MQHLMHWLRSRGHRVGQGWSPDPEADKREAVRLAQAGVDRDPNNIRAITLLAHYRSFLFGDYDRALTLFKRALDLSPNNAWAWALSAPTHTYIGDPESAIARTERALRLSPRDLLAFYFHTSLCIAHYTAGAYEEAVHWGQIALSKIHGLPRRHVRPQLRLARWATNLRRRRCCKFCYGLTLPSAPRFTLLGIHTAMSRGGNYWNSIFWPQGSHQ